MLNEKELIQMIEEENQGVDLDFDKYLNLATTLIDSLTPTQLNYLQKLFQVRELEDKDFTVDLCFEIYAYLLDKIEKLK